MKEEGKIENSIVIKENEIRGEKFIFDILIKEKLAHVIVIKDNQHYHINLDGEDLGYFTKEEDGSNKRNPQHKGAHLDDEAYFKPIEEKMEALERMGEKGLMQSAIDKKEINNVLNTAPKDGLDNTGTQGYDSLSDDAFTGSSKKPQEYPSESKSRTGSATKDFHDAK